LEAVKPSQLRRRIVFTIQNSILLKKNDITEKSRDELLNYFNKEQLPVDIVLSADVRHLPSKERERVLFGHPFNLFDEIKEAMDKGKAEAASISFNNKTYVLQVCLGQDLAVHIFISNREIPTEER
jgi:hypothetical protein